MTRGQVVLGSGFSCMSSGPRLTRPVSRLELWSPASASIFVGVCRPELCHCGILTGGGQPLPPGLPGSLGFCVLEASAGKGMERRCPGPHWPLGADQPLPRVGSEWAWALPVVGASGGDPTPDFPLDSKAAQAVPGSAPPPWGPGSGITFPLAPRRGHSAGAAVNLSGIPQPHLAAGGLQTTGLYLMLRRKLKARSLGLSCLL